MNVSIFLNKLLFCCSGCGPQARPGPLPAGSTGAVPPALHMRLEKVWPKSRSKLGDLQKEKNSSQNFGGKNESLRIVANTKWVCEDVQMTSKFVL